MPYILWLLHAYGQYLNFHSVMLETWIILVSLLFSESHQDFLIDMII